MKRVFIPIESVTIAHVVRPLRVAQALRKRGVEVIFGVHDHYREFIKKEGFQTYPLYCQDPEVLLNAVRTLDFKKQIESLPSYLESDMKALEELKPLDLVLADFRFTIRMAAEKKGIPHVALINGYYSPYYNITPEMPWILSHHLPPFLAANLSLRKLLKQCILKFQALPYKELNRKYRTPAQINTGFDITVSKTLTLICDLPEFTPQHNLPSNFQFVGPILWEPDGRPNEFESFFNKKNNRPLIYLTCGTSGDEASFRHLIRALGNTPYDIIFSTGNQYFQGLPDNVYAFPFIKASEVLKRSSLMICHGGNGSIYQALQQGVAVLCVTTFFDQEWNGQRVRELGLGESIYHKDLIHSPIMPIIERILNSSEIRQNLDRFRNVMAKQDGAENAADKIVACLNTTA